MFEDKKALVRRFWEEFVNHKNLDAPEEFYTPNFVWHEPDQDVSDFKQVRQFASMYFEAFPDVTITLDDVLLAEDEKVVIRWTARGTQQGETEEFGSRTGRRFELEGITIHRFEGNKIAEHWDRFDNLGFAKQLGIAVDPYLLVRGFTTN